MGDVDSKRLSVDRFKIFFTYAIDLGYLMESDDAIHHLQGLRGKDRLSEKLCSVFDCTHETAWTFSDPSLERERLKSNAQAAISRGGKNIWSELFLDKHVPIWFQSTQADSLSPAITARPGSFVMLEEVAQTRNTGVRYDGSEFRIFRDGVLCLRFQFSRESREPEIGVDEFIRLLDTLEKETFEGYVYRVNGVLRDWRGSSHTWQNLGLPLRMPDSATDDVIRTSSVEHSCLFLEGVHEPTTCEPVSMEALGIRSFLLGILNKSRWYTKYADRYVERTFDKNVGYRADEIYFTDKDSSLILLADYWDETKPLSIYIYDLVLAVEFEIAKLAHLDFVLHYMQADPYSREALDNPSGERAIGLVLQTRNILTLVQEALETNSLIVHGFTRRFITQLAVERNLSSHVGTIERRIANIHDAIELRASIDIGRQSIVVESGSLKVALVALVISAVLTLVEVLLTIWSLFGRTLFPLQP